MEPVNVDRLVQEIREKVRQRVSATTNAVPAEGGEPVSHRLRMAMAGWESKLQDIEIQSLAIGQPTPAPPTLRGWIGAWVMRCIGRVLWWYSYRLRELSIRSLQLHGEQRRALQDLAEDHVEAARRERERVNNLEAAVAELRRAGVTQEAIAALRREMADLGDMQTAIAELRGELDRLAAAGTVAVRGQTDSLSAKLETMAHKQTALEQRLSELGMFAHQTRAECSIQDRRISTLLREVRSRQFDNPEPSAPTAGRCRVPDNHALYVAFEDVYRGTRDEIKTKQRVYLPVLLECGVGGPHRPLLDIGCGRGEWLELLRENNIAARGVDCNGEMIERCRGTGLEVYCADALAHLRSLPEASLGAVSAFHVIEHLPFETVLELMDECLRVIRCGGLLILETPNPQNLQVGAHTFYLDPTHLKPLPSGMLRFFVEARGFCDVQIRELNPYPAPMHLPEQGDGVAARFNALMYGAQDYAVIGHRP